MLAWIKHHYKWAVALFLILAVTGPIAILIVFNTGREPILTPLHLESAGLESKETTVRDGKHGEMVFVSGLFNDGEVVAIVHRGNEKGWRTFNPEAKIAIYEISEEINEFANFVFNLENIWVTCKNGRICMEFETSLRLVTDDIS